MLSDYKINESQSVKMEASICTNVGCVRENNEDNYLFDGEINRDNVNCQFIFSDETMKNYKCFGVFDGMGGGAYGEKASLIAAETLNEMLSTIDEEIDKFEIDSLMRKGFLGANNRIQELKEEKQVCGTTGTALILHQNKYKIYHIGDSRAYRIRNNEMECLTKDQTLAQMKIDVGIYGSTDEIPERDKHQLTEYIGRDYTRESIRPIESEWLEFLPGDKVLLCTDGLYDMCSDEEIRAIITRSENVGVALENLVEAALKCGGIDNITCILLSQE